MTDDDRFEDFVREAASRYNEPPPAPRGAMWARIDAARATRRGVMRATRTQLLVRWGAGIAAVLAVGIGIGRLTAPGENGGVTFRPGDVIDAQAADQGFAFQAAALDYLGRSEAFISLFRSEARAGTADEQMAEWARDLLTTGRLMMDSPAGQDPQMRALLEDLELILIQIAQYTQELGREELEIIEEGIDEGGLELRLQNMADRELTPDGEGDL